MRGLTGCSADVALLSLGSSPGFHAPGSCVIPQTVNPSELKICIP